MAEEDGLVVEAAMRIPADAPLGATRKPRVLLFTDTLADVNGVSRFIRDMSAAAYQRGLSLNVITSQRLEVPDRPYFHNIAPRLALPMPGYPGMELVIPRVLDMLARARELRPDVIHISTPGPVGAVGLLAARRLGLPRLGVYHTDFPAFVEKLLGEGLARVARAYMRLFYRSFHTLFSRSADYIERMRRIGIDTSRSVRLVPGIALDKFDARYRDPELWRAYPGLRPEALKFLFVGRVSREKNLEMLCEIWPRVRAECARAGRAVELVVVGDGPYREEMERRLAGKGAHFLGFRYGEELSRIYASSHLFIFPSMTDTLGQVVLESQASGLAAVVSDQGGPKEFVDEGITGSVLPGRAPEAWVARLVELAIDDSRRQSMGRTAYVRMRRYPVASSFDRFWASHALADGARESGGREQADERRREDVAEAA